MKHADKNTLLQNAYLAKIIEDEVRRRTADQERQVEACITGTHCVDFLIGLTILSDVYDASTEWLEVYIDQWEELINQYNSGKLSIKKLMTHLNEKHGVRVM